GLVGIDARVDGGRVDVARGGPDARVPEAAVVAVVVAEHVECAVDELLVLVQAPHRRGEYAVAAEDTEHIGLRDGPRDVRAAAVGILGDGEACARIVLVDFGLQSREQIDRPVRAELRDPTRLAERRIPKAAWGLLARGRDGWIGIGLRDAYIADPHLRIPMDVQHVEQPATFRLLRERHLLQIEIEEVAVVRVARVLQPDHALPAVVDRTEDHRVRIDVLDRARVLDRALDQFGVGHVRSRVPSFRAAQSRVRRVPQIRLVIETEEDRRARMAYRVRVGDVEEVNPFVLIDKLVREIRRGEKGAAWLTREALMEANIQI